MCSLFTSSRSQFWFARGGTRSPDLSFSLFAPESRSLKVCTSTNSSAMLRLAEDGMNKFTIVFQRCEEGGFTAQIKEVPGAISEGETAREAAENVFDALVQVLAAQAEEQLRDLDETPKEIELALS